MFAVFFSAQFLHLVFVTNTRNAYVLQCGWSCTPTKYFHFELEIRKKTVFLVWSLKCITGLIAGSQTSWWLPQTLNCTILDLQTQKHQKIEFASLSIEWFLFRVVAAINLFWCSFATPSVSNTVCVQVIKSSPMMARYTFIVNG